LRIYFDYYSWSYQETVDSEMKQDIVITKAKTSFFQADSKKLISRRTNQRKKSIDDLKLLGARFESMSGSFPHLTGYQERMKRLFSHFQLEIQRFEETDSFDFKNAILTELQGSNTQIIEDLLTLVPSGLFNEDGTPIMVETYKGIMQRLV